jgi:hypothetical protein
LKETRLQREHMQRLRRIDEQLEYLHRPMIEERMEAILSDEQLNELLGKDAQCYPRQAVSSLFRSRPVCSG